MRQLLIFGWVIAGLICAYVVISSIIVAQTSGTLVVTSPGATLTIIKPNYKPVNIGLGKARVRLAPGNYQLVATKKTNQSITNINIKKQQTLVEVVTPTTPAQSQQALQTAQANNLIKQLPYEGPGSAYNVSYYYKYSGMVAQPIILITAPTQAAQQAAVAWIGSIGYNPSNLNIEYVTASAVIPSLPTSSGAPTSGQ